jgi:phage gp45-like
MSQAARAFKRRVMQILDREVLPDLLGLVELVRVGSVSGAAGSRPEATGDGEEPIKVLEPYGYASTPPGSATAVALAPGTDAENRVAVGVSSTAGRPATSAGDTAVWTAAGHVILLDDDGGLTITAKDGQVIDLAATGAVTISAGTASSVTINVDGGQFVNIGDGGAATLVQAQALETYLAAEFAAVTSPDPNIVAAFAALALSIGGAPPPSLVTATATTKARGT